MMKTLSVLFGLLFLIFKAQAESVNLYFEPGSTFRSEYSKDFGSAAIVMTGNPGYLLITTNQNKCEKNKCQTKVFEDDLNHALFRFSYLNQNDKVITYRGRLVPFRAFWGSITFPKGYEDTLAKNDITIVADKNPNQLSTSLLKVDSLVMKINFEGYVRVYHLKKVSR